MTILPEMLPVWTPLGRAYAYAVIDAGPVSDLQWICWMRESGECWTFRNPYIRLEENITLGVKNDASHTSHPSE